MRKDDEISAASEHGVLCRREELYSTVGVASPLNSPALGESKTELRKDEGEVLEAEAIDEPRRKVAPS